MLFKIFIFLKIYITISFYFPLKGRVTVLEDRSLKLDDITLEDMGEYTCEADNAVGSITATGILTVHGKFPLELKNLKFL